MKIRNLTSEVRKSGKMKRGRKGAGERYIDRYGGRSKRVQQLPQGNLSKKRTEEGYREALQKKTGARGRQATDRSSAERNGIKKKRRRGGTG